MRLTKRIENNKLNIDILDERVNDLVSNLKDFLGFGVLSVIMLLIILAVADSYNNVKTDCEYLESMNIKTVDLCYPSLWLPVFMILGVIGAIFLTKSLGGLLEILIRG